MQSCVWEDGWLCMWGCRPVEEQSQCTRGEREEDRDEAVISSADCQLGGELQDLVLCWYQARRAPGRSPRRMCLVGVGKGRRRNLAGL